MNSNGFTSTLWDMVRGPSRKIQIPYDNSRVVEMTAESVQAPDEHFGFYDMSAMYAPEMPAYNEPESQAWFEDMRVASTHLVAFHHEPVSQPEPQGVTYDDCLMTHEFLKDFTDLIKPLDNPRDELQLGVLGEVRDVVEELGFDIAPFNTDHERNLQKIEQAVIDIQNSKFDQPMMDPFGPGPMM